MRSSSRVLAARTVMLGVVAALVVIVAVIKPQLALFAAAGLFAGWLTRAVLARRWNTIRAVLLAASVAFCVAMVAVLGRSLFVACPGCGSADVDRFSVPVTTQAEWNDTGFSVTDTVTVTDKAAAAIVRSVVTDTDPMPDAELDPFIAAMSATERSDIVRSTVTAAGWTFTGSIDGAPTFQRVRTQAVTVPRWPLSTIHHIDQAEVRVDGTLMVLVPDDDSIATVTVPEHWVRRTFPNASSTQATLDGDSELFTVPYAQAPGEVRVELLSPLARNPVMSSIVGFSAWGAAKWFVLLAVAVLTDDLKEALKALWARVKKTFATKPPAPNPGPDDPNGPYL